MAGKTRSPITTHVLNIARGKPGAGIAVLLERKGASAKWTTVARGKTNSDGRIEDLLTPGSKAPKGIYRLTFDTSRVSDFFPSVSIVFKIKSPNEHHHLPLLLSPFGFSTYRGT